MFLINIVFSVIIFTHVLDIKNVVSVISRKSIEKIERLSNIVQLHVTCFLYMTLKFYCRLFVFSIFIIHYFKMCTKTLNRLVQLIAYIRGSQFVVVFVAYEHEHDLNRLEVVNVLLPVLGGQLFVILIFFGVWQILIR